MNGYVNKQNFWIWADENPRMIQQQVLHSQKVTVCCALWSKGVYGQYFVENDDENAITVNSERYRNMISNYFWNWILDVKIVRPTIQFARQSLYWIQSLVSVLFQEMTTSIVLQDHVDFFLWGYLKSRVYSNCPTTVKQLKN